MKNRVLCKRLLAVALSVFLIVASMSLLGCEVNDGESSDIVANEWSFGKNDPVKRANVGDMYLNQTTFDIYSYTDIGWVKVGNIKGEIGEQGKSGLDGIDGVDGAKGDDFEIESVTTSSDGYLVINGVKTSVSIYMPINSSTLTGNYYISQGSFAIPDSTTRCRVVITKRVRSGAVVTFTGGDAYQFGVIQSDATTLATQTWYSDSLWQNNNASYATKKDNGDFCYIILNYRYSNDATITPQEIEGLLSKTTITGMFENYFFNNEESEGMNVNTNINSVNHRGYSAIAPENTLAAYRLSKKMGFTAVECDVSFTKDGIPVLLHDSTIDRTCASGQTGDIGSWNYADLATLDFSYDKTDYAGEKIPTLDEFLALCKNLGLQPYIELKASGTTTEQAKIVANKVIRNGMKGKISYISFNLSLLNAIKEVDDTARLGFLASALFENQISSVVALKTGKNEVFMDCDYYYMTNSTNSANSLSVTVDRCIANGLALEVWTVNDRNVMLNLDPYISGVTSDNLAVGDVLYYKSK